MIDTIALRSHMGLLLEAFSDSNLVKVFHGCHSDILWLQRDFGLYVVNCFDTYQSSKLLKYPALSLAHLLKFYCGITVNKKYQLADWRQRPLTAELMQYARDDTHYLLYIYDCLRRDVVREYGIAGLCAVFDASRKTCLLRYKKEEFDRLGYLQLFQGPRKNFIKIRAAELTATQDSLLMCLWDWRDFHARFADESPAFIMSNAELIRLGMLEQLPRTVAELEKAGQPLSAYVVANLEDLLAAMHAAVFGTTNRHRDDAKVAAAAKGNKPAGSGSSRFVSVRGSGSGVRQRLNDSGPLQMFTPTIEPLDHASPSVPPLGNGRRVGLSRGTPSPSTDANIESDIDELLKKVGWVQQKSAAAEQPTTASRPVSSSNFCEPLNPKVREAFERVFSVANSPELQQQSDIQEEEEDTDSDGSEKMDIVDLADDDVAIAPEKVLESENLVQQIPVSEKIGMTQLPQSLSEIYNLSNYNRKNRNRDRKRSRLASSEAGPDNENARNTAEALYFSESAAALSSDGTIQEATSFLEKIEWIDESGKRELIEKYSQPDAEVANAPSTLDLSEVPRLSYFLYWIPIINFCTGG